MTVSSATFNGNTADSGSDIYNYNGTLNIGGTIGNSAGSIDIYMNNTAEFSPVLVPVKGITLANETHPISNLNIANMAPRTESCCKLPLNSRDGKAMNI